MIIKWIILISSVSVYGAFSKRSDDYPKWSENYQISGTLHIPYAEIKEPFFAWYSSADNLSRIDYYGGMVKTYQLATKGKFGVSLKLAPVTTEKEMNAETCLQINGTSDNVIKIQTILPSLKNFKFIGTEIVRRYRCQKWSYIDNSFTDKVSKYTMWYRVQSSETSQTLIPVRYEMIGYNTLLGSHYDHYYVDYTKFTPEKPNSKAFEVPDNMTCVGFPGPGLDHTYTFNPMKEFIDNHDAHIDEAFDDFHQNYDVDYNNITEHSLRKNIFKYNMRFIQSKNRANLGYTLGVNHLADRTPDELRVLRGKKYTTGYNGGKPFPYRLGKNHNDVPDTMDWRINGAVTPVKDQSVCGSCWSFGTTGAIEGAYFVKTGQLLRFSQQALIDCSWGYGNNGCDGGEDFRSYQWVMKHGGIPTEDEYGPYLGQDGYCRVNDVQLRAPIANFVNVTTNNADALRLAVARHGPISIAIDASPRTFSFYSNGVYYDESCKNKIDELDHAVLLIGYGKFDNKKYWLVKNSWSNYWGNQGYILIAEKNNNCGVMTSPTYVNLK